MSVKNILKLRFFLFGLLGLIILFLIYQAIVPFGKITYKTNFCNNSFIISKLKPTDRTNGKCQNIITGDPVYFDLNTQRTFNSAKVTLQYRTGKRNSGISPSDLNPIIELGLLANQQKNYILKPVENKIIDNLTPPTEETGQGWDKITEDDITLLQRNPKFQSVDEFLNNLPAKDKIAIYKYDLPITESEIPASPKLQRGEPEFRLQEITTIDKPLRGAYQLYTYIDNEELNWQFDFFDINEGEKADPITVNLYYNNQLIATQNLTDDGIIEVTRKKTDVRNLKLQLNNLPTGIYKIAVVASNDIITKEIKTKQSVVSFINKVWLYENNNTELIELYTDSSEINARTNNPIGLQKILLNNKILNLNKTYQQFTQATQAPLTKIQLAKDSVLFIGDGVFSFTENSLYNPSYKKINKSTDVDTLGIDYVITNYQPTIVVDDWKMQTLEFDLHNIWREDNNYGFIITVPGLNSEDDINDYMEIREIKIELQGTSAWKKIKKFLNFKF